MSSYHIKKYGMIHNSQMLKLIARIKQNTFDKFVNLRIYLDLIKSPKKRQNLYENITIKRQKISDRLSLGMKFVAIFTLAHGPLGNKLAFLR